MTTAAGLQKESNFHRTRGAGGVAMKNSLTIVVLGLLLATPVGALDWDELGDAPSYPDGQAQRTFGDRLIQKIEGELDQATGDARDAYCIRIVDPISFVATTHPLLHPDAGGNFDTRLYLFTPEGLPVLANDNAIQGGFGLSLLKVNATDGSGFLLGKPGEYVLVVAGAPDDPRDDEDSALFRIEDDPLAIHAADPLSGSFREWSIADSGNQSGSYSVGLKGVETCGVVDMAIATVERNRVCITDGAGGFAACGDVSADEGFSYKPALGDIDGDGSMDVVFAMSLQDPNRVCLGDGRGGFTGCTEVSADAFDTAGVVLGDLDEDGLLDAVFANSGDPSRICLGEGLGGFSGCSDISPSAVDANDVALGDLNGDSHQDVVLAVYSGVSQACLGNGSGAFSQCLDVDLEANTTYRVALGQVNSDGILDAVFANIDEADSVCLGNGTGGFQSCSPVDAEVVGSHGVALGDVNGDLAMDAVFAVSGSANRVCLGDATGGFSCAPIGPDTESAFDVALGHVDEDGYLDALFGRTHGPERVCLGDGTGAFSCSDVSADSMLAAGVAAGKLDLRLQTIFFDHFETGDKSAWSMVVE
jgi:hypothetical protein